MEARLAGRCADRARHLRQSTACASAVRACELEDPLQRLERKLVHRGHGGRGSQRCSVRRGASGECGAEWVECRARDGSCHGWSCSCLAIGFALAVCVHLPSTGARSNIYRIAPARPDPLNTDPHALACLSAARGVLRGAVDGLGPRLMIPSARAAAALLDRSRIQVLSERATPPRRR